MNSMRPWFGCIAIALSLLASQSHAQGLIFQMRAKAPDSTFRTDLTIESAHLNLKRALEKCHTYPAVIAGAVYPGLKRSELEFYQAVTAPILIAFAVAEADGEGSKVSVWVQKPTFGTGLSFIAKLAQQMTLQGAAYQCTSDW